MSAVRAVEAGGNGRLFGQAVQDRNEGGNRVQRAVQLRQRVEYGRGSRDTEGEGGGCRKQSDSGTRIIDNM